MEPATLARRYYQTVDCDDYEGLTDLLAPAFTHYRPDRTIEGRERFVRFMREGRPETDTSHVLDALYTGADGVAVQGRLRRADGSEWFRFVDVFRIDGAVLVECRTYTA